MTKKESARKDKERILGHLKSVPIIEVACKKANIARATYYRWRNEDTEFLRQSEEALQDGIDMINDMTEFYHKLFIFFQGLLSGLCLMHLLIIFLGADTNLTNYSHLSLRLNQVFHIVSLLSVFGSIYRSIHAKTLCNIENSLLILILYLPFR